MIRDTYRAFLALVVGLALVAAARLSPPAAPAAVQQPVQAVPVPQQAYQPQPAWGQPQPPAWQPAPPPYVVTVAQPPDRPIARVGGAFVELTESLLGVVRR